MSGKIVVIELLPELLSTNQIAGFQKVQYLKNELRNEDYFLYVSHNSIGTCLTQVSMPKLVQNDKRAIYLEDKMKDPMKSLLPVPISPSDGQFNIFLRSQ